MILSRQVARYCSGVNDSPDYLRSRMHRADIRTHRTPAGEVAIPGVALTALES